MKTLYYYDEKQLKHVEYPQWKLWVGFSIVFALGMLWMWFWILMFFDRLESKVTYRYIQYEDSTTIIYQPINPDSIKGDSKVAKDLRWQYRKNKKK